MIPPAEPSPAVRRPFGRGRAVSLFTLGTMRAVEGAEQMERVLSAAIEAGINHLETAPAYGPAETFLGRALKALEGRDAGSRAALVITSKVLPGPSLATGNYLRRWRPRFTITRDGITTSTSSFNVPISWCEVPFNLLPTNIQNELLEVLLVQKLAPR